MTTRTLALQLADDGGHRPPSARIWARLPGWATSWRFMATSARARPRLRPWPDPGAGRARNRSPQPHLHAGPDLSGTRNFPDLAFRPLPAHGSGEARELGLGGSCGWAGADRMAGKTGPLIFPHARLEVRLSFGGRGPNRPPGGPRRLEHAVSMATGGNLRSSEISEFLTRAGWGEAARTPLTARRLHPPL